MTKNKLILNETKNNWQLAKAVVNYNNFHFKNSVS